MVCFIWKLGAIMIMREVLEEIAQEEGGKFRFEEEILPESSWGASTPEGHNKLNIWYRGIEIQLIFTTMTHCIAQIKLILPLQDRNFEFEITTGSRLMKIFSKNKKRIKIESSNLSFQEFLEADFGLEQLNIMTEDYAFDPYIHGKNNSHGFLIRTEFHLQFPERTEVVRPLIFFYKTLIDKLIL